jgi:hypothetical protein
VLPYTDAEAADELWDVVLPAACRQARSENVLAWLELYEAVGARNPRRMALSAEHVLKKDLGADRARRQYAFSAAMLAHLAGGRPEETLSLWERREAVLGEVAMTAELQFLLETAQARAARR